jgi:HD-GYP domain-containing protein (c-di-GMP phosphodiesterase class II)
LHDVGKLGVSNRILDKPGKLTDAKFAEIKKHPKLTQEILSCITPFRGIAEAAANHHEKLDGSGYHRELTAPDLDLPSRTLVVADVYDALTQIRPYREALPKEKALEILTREGGRGLCPTSVATLNELAAQEVL